MNSNNAHDRDEKEQEEYQKTLEQASVYFENKEWDIAEELYKEALEIRPDDKLCILQLIKIKDIYRLLESDQKEYEKTIVQAFTYFANKEWNIAEELYKEALEIRPEDKICLEQLQKIKDRRSLSDNDQEENESTVEQSTLYLEKEENEQVNDTISEKNNGLEKVYSQVEYEAVVAGDSPKSPIDNFNASEPENELYNWPSTNQDIRDKDVTEIIKTNPKSKKNWIIAGSFSIFTLLFLFGYLLFNKETPPSSPPETRNILVVDTDENAKSIESSKTGFPKGKVQEEQKAEPVIKMKLPKTEVSLTFENGNYYRGKVKTGKMHGKGTYYFNSEGLISEIDPFERIAMAGDSIVGTWYEGELEKGNLYGKDGVLKEKIVLQHN